MRDVGYSDAEIAALVAPRPSLTPMKIIYTDKHAQHDPQTFIVRGVKQRSAEQPERATRLLSAAKGAGHEIQAPKSTVLRRPRPCTRRNTSTSCRPPRATGRSCRALRRDSAQRAPGAPSATYPKARRPRGWDQVDTACPIGPGAWEQRSRRPSRHTAATSCSRSTQTYSSAGRRPSRLRRHGGRLLLPNNTAIAAQHLRASIRAWPCSMSTCITATARRASSTNAPTC